MWPCWKYYLTVFRYLFSLHRPNSMKLLIVDIAIKTGIKRDWLLFNFICDIWKVEKNYFIFAKLGIRRLYLKIILNTDWFKFTWNWSIITSFSYSKMKICGNTLFSMENTVSLISILHPSIVDLYDSRDHWEWHLSAVTNYV